MVVEGERHHGGWLCWTGQLGGLGRVGEACGLGSGRALRSSVGGGGGADQGEGAVETAAGYMCPCSAAEGMGKLEVTAVLRLLLFSLLIEETVPSSPRMFLFT